MSYSPKIALHRLPHCTSLGPCHSRSDIAKSFETGKPQPFSHIPQTSTAPIFDLRLSLVDPQKTPEVSTRGKVSVNLFAKIRFLSTLWSPPQKGETIPATSKILKGAMGGLGRREPCGFSLSPKSNLNPNLFLPCFCVCEL